MGTTGTNERKRALTVGLFVLIGLVILVAGILVLGKMQNKFSKNLVVTTYFNDVKGLKVGNNVWFSGVKVGIVTEITFQSIDGVKVVMHIAEKASEFIRADAVAKLSSDGLIGNAIVSLVGGSHQAAPIADGSVIQSTSGRDTDAMFATLQTNNENLVEITKNLAILSRQMVEGKGTVGTLMTDQDLALSLKKSVNSLGSVMEEVNRSTAALSALMHKLNGSQGLIHDLTTDTIVFANLRASASQLQEVAQAATTLMGNLNETSTRLNDKDNVVSLLTNDPQAAAEIKQILHNLNASSAKLDENMKALQSNFLFRGYFRKKAKSRKETI